MTLDEFAARLPLLSDGKIRRMIVAAKRDGLNEPLAVLKAEARRRGWKKSPPPSSIQEGLTETKKTTTESAPPAAPIYDFNSEISVTKTTFIPKEMPLDEVLLASSSSERPHFWMHSESTAQSPGNFPGNQGIRFSEKPPNPAPLPVPVNNRISNGKLTGGWAIAALLLVAVGGLLIRTLRSR